MSIPPRDRGRAGYLRAVEHGPAPAAAVLASSHLSRAMASLSLLCSLAVCACADDGDPGEDPDAGAGADSAVAPDAREDPVDLSSRMTPVKSAVMKVGSISYPLFLVHMVVAESICRLLPDCPAFDPGLPDFDRISL